MGGGGGQSQTSNSGLPDWARPYVEDSLKSAVDLYGTGAFEHVQGLNPEQQQALSQTKELAGQGGAYDRIAADSYDATGAYRDAASGRGLFGADALGNQTRELADTIGNAQQNVLGQQAGNFSRSGNLGGARAEAAASQAALQTGGELAANELAQRRQASLQGAAGTLGAGGQLQSQLGYGASQLGNVGTALQQQQQNEGDATYQGVQRLFGLYGSPAIGQKSTTTSSGGGK